MTRLDRILKLLEDYDRFAYLNSNKNTESYLEKLRSEKEKLTQELIEHGCRRSVDRISQDIFSEKPAMQQYTWSGGW